MVDARLPDGSRVNAIIPPLALDGPVLSIRRFGGTPLRIEDLLAHQQRDARDAGLPGGLREGASSTSSSAAAPAPARRRCSTRCRPSSRTTSASSPSRTPPSCSSSSGTSCAWRRARPTSRARARSLARDLVKNALRMRPDRIIIGECRGGEVLDMLQAMNTGHEGSMTTVHANTPRDALSRIETMVGMGGVQMSETLVRQTIARSLNLIVQLDARHRRQAPHHQHLRDHRHGGGRDHHAGDLPLRAAGRRRGRRRSSGEFRATGVRPQALERIERYGIDPAEIVEPYSDEDGADEACSSSASPRWRWWRCSRRSSTRCASSSDRKRDELQAAPAERSAAADRGLRRRALLRAGQAVVQPRHRRDPAGVADRGAARAPARAGRARDARWRSCCSACCDLAARRGRSRWRCSARRGRRC